MVVGPGVLEVFDAYGGGLRGERTSENASGSRGVDVRKSDGPSHDLAFVFVPAALLVIDNAGLRCVEIVEFLRIHRCRVNAACDKSKSDKMESGDASEVDHNQRGKRKQLKAGMEHLRCVVTVPESPLSTPSSDMEESDAYGVPAHFQPVRKPKTDASNNPQKRTDPFQFGSRYLEEGDDIFDYNAWDHVETDEAYKEFAEEQYAKQRQDPVNDFDKSM